MLKLDIRRRLVSFLVDLCHVIRQTQNSTITIDYFHDSFDLCHHDGLCRRRCEHGLSFSRGQRKVRRDRAFRHHHNGHATGLDDHHELDVPHREVAR